MSSGLLHLYIGDGKGKTTASMGLALRFLGHSKRVLIAQYLKNGCSGETIALRDVQGAFVFDMPVAKKFSYQMTDSELSDCLIENESATERLKQAINEYKPDLTVLDELATAASLGLLSESVMTSVIDCALSLGEVCATGFRAPESLYARADYISEVVKRRHPFDKGICARECVEW